MSPEQIDSIVQILTKARTDQQVKLRFGARKRIQIAEGLGKEDFDKTHYRYQWLKQARNAVIETLGAQAEVLNTQNPHDCASIQDFFDILNSVLLQLKASLNDKS